LKAVRRTLFIAMAGDRHAEGRRNRFGHGLRAKSRNVDERRQAEIKKADGTLVFGGR
jgi:hypothetical protein